MTTPKPAKVPKGFESWLDVLIWAASDASRHAKFPFQFSTGKSEPWWIDARVLCGYARLELVALRKQARKRGGK